MALVSKIDNNSTTKIPDEIIEKAGLKPGSDIIWLYDDRSKQILLMEKTENLAASSRGLGKVFLTIYNDYLLIYLNVWDLLCIMSLTYRKKKVPENPSS